MRRMILLALAGFPLVGAARADVVYSNILSPQLTTVGTFDRWDDATIVGGGVLSGFSMWAANAMSGDPRMLMTEVSIHLFDGANNRPDGALLGTFTVTTPPIAVGAPQLVSTGDLTGLGIVLPINARLGVKFDFMQNSSIVMYDPPTVGSSADAIWTGTPPTPDPIPGRVGNLGFAIEVVPSPGGAALLGVGCAVTLRRRR